MKQLLLTVIIGLYCYCLSAQAKATVYEFTKATTKGTLKTVTDDTLSLTLSSQVVKTFDIENVEKIKINTGKGTKKRSTIIGVAIGMIPGILLLSAKTEPEPTGSLVGAILIAPVAAAAEITTKILGGVLLPVGGIIGGIIGSKVGKSGEIEIPIYGNKKLYQKQQENIRQYSY